jgi:hypothetical protein
VATSKSAERALRRVFPEMLATCVSSPPETNFYTRSKNQKAIERVHMYQVTLTHKVEIRFFEIFW